MQPPRKQVPRVDRSTEAATKITIAKGKQSVLRVTAQKRQSVPRVENNKINTGPNCNSNKGKDKDKEKIGGTMNNRTRVQRATKEVALAVHTAPRDRSEQQKKAMSNMQQKLNKIANEVERAIAVMDQATGKMLNYRQLQHNPKYKAVWNISAANKFGRLANGVGGRIKGTKTIKFI